MASLSPFSYVVLTLVGRGGATAPELVAMMDRGRLYWTAPRSQWYAEPKRLAAAGLLDAEQEPGRTGPRVRYRLTDAGRAAVAAWVREPVGLPQIKNEAVARVLAADLADSPADVLAGLRPLREELATARAATARAIEIAAGVPDRGERLGVQHEMAMALVDAFERWLDEVERLLGADASLGSGARTEERTTP
jgi:DNA-binding PadR family transcriptional regulator